MKQMANPVMETVKKNRILDVIRSPQDLHALTDDELQILCDEIRDQIIQTTSRNGGHVASSLGAVEIIVALHSILNAPKDKIVYDVGHQAYAHKLLTGRLDSFDTLRMYGGISGFPLPSESDYDVYASGHASDSLSIASGLAQARVMNGSDEKIVAVIGDASLTGGMAFEALNYIGSQNLPLLIVLNDNGMSISKSVGALMRHLGNIRATSEYRNARESLQDFLEHSGKMGEGILDFGKRLKEASKHFFISQSMIYEQLGIVCTAPINGHDIKELREILQICLAMDEPVLVHALTQKGKGYAPAENDPTRFHGIGPYKIETGESKSCDGDEDNRSTSGKGQATHENKGKKFTDVYGRALVEEARGNPNIIAICAAMEDGCGLTEFHEAFPDRFVDVGIAEEQAVGMAAGLAIAGKKPVVSIYSTFLQRAIDQIITDVALTNLDVVFSVDRGGLVGADGATHHGIFDISYLRMVPNMKIIAPSCSEILVSGLHTALAVPGPVAIRFPRGYTKSLTDLQRKTGDISSEPQDSCIPVGKSHTLQDGQDVAFLAFGRMVETALDAAAELASVDIYVRVVDMIWAKPMDIDAILAAAKDCRLIATLEEGCIAGGAGEGILEILSEHGIETQTMVFGIPDSFVHHGPVKLLLKDTGLDAHDIAERVKETLKRKS